MNSLSKLKRRTWKYIDDKGDDSNISELDNHDIYTSENELNSIEDFEDGEAKKLMKWSII